MATPDEMRSEYEAGASVYQIANRHGLSPSWVARKLRSAGTPMRHRGSACKESVAITKAMIRLHKQGKLHKQIAYEFGVSQQEVSRRLISAGCRRYAPSMGA